MRWCEYGWVNVWTGRYKGERLMLFFFCSFFFACVSLTIMLFFFQKSQPLENLLNSSC
ncbi:hypothetical protein BDV30DRAFT_218235 [Aspergillus minisclerotigenes]|uniref:Uncharacterized protein n=1 Tax=Aspergillus minisclerotigenes TaxID=656917 RepID=A0A5N6IQQ6_9EURO|nr:hypothetical protein BDV30DRAFT_218235 [Aspergillus minisclerotigenes]